jgi:hypothetical protein
VGQALPALPAGRDVLEIGGPLNLNRRGDAKGFAGFSATVIIAYAAAFSPAAFAVSTGEYFAEAGVGALCGDAVAGAGFALFFFGNEAMSGNDDNTALMAGGVTLMFASPAATAAGVYFMGEAVDGAPVPLYGVTMHF